LAPERLRADVNNAAQIKMVEHYNLIIRKKAELDHTEARGIHLQTIQRASDEMGGYVTSGGDPEVVGAKMLELRVLIEQGDRFNYYLDDEKAMLLNGIDRQYAMSSIIENLLNLAPNDDIAAADLIEGLVNFGNGTGTIQMVDEAGNIAKVPALDLPMTHDERMTMAEYAINLVNQRSAAFDNVNDSRLLRDKKDFYDWFDKHAVYQALSKQPLDLNRLLFEFRVADDNINTFGYDDSLRNEIKNIILSETLNQRTETMSQWEIDFLAGFGPWMERTSQELQKRLGDRPISSLTQQEQRDIEHQVRMTVGSVPGGNKQSAEGARTIGKYYTALTSRDYTPEFYENLIANWDSRDVQELEWQIDTQMSKIGIWSEASINAIVGKLMTPEGMNPETLQRTLDVARMFWDNPSFRNNMMDENALGRTVGGALNDLFSYGGQPTIGNVNKLLENYSDPNYSRFGPWANVSEEDRQLFLQTAEVAIADVFEADWYNLWSRTGKVVGGRRLDFNPWNSTLAGIPGEVTEAVKIQLMAESGHIDRKRPESFYPYIRMSVDKVLHDKGYGASAIGYSQVRHSEVYHGAFMYDWFAGYRKPDYAISQFPPEYFAMGQPDASGKRSIDQNLMKFTTEDFQEVLNDVAKQRNDEKWIAGENAALVYNGERAAAFGYPTWDIMLILADGTTEILTQETPYGVSRINFNMNDARVRNDKFRADGGENNKLSVRMRVNSQNGNVSNFDPYALLGPENPVWTEMPKPAKEPVWIELPET
jgi:hypothetical protein